MLLCLQLPVKMVRCGQHATLAVQLAASSAPLWGRKSTSSLAVPTIAEEDAGSGAYPGAASPPPAAPLSMVKTSCKEEGTMVHVLASSHKQQVQPTSSPGENGALQAESASAQSRVGLTQQYSSLENGENGHGDTSKAPPADPPGAKELQQLPTKGAQAPAVPASEVFREHQPCRRPAKPLQGFANMPTEGAPGGLHANGSMSRLRETSSYIDGRVGGSHVKLAQLHPSGSIAAQSQMLCDSAGGAPHRCTLDTFACFAMLCGLHRFCRL